MNIHFPSTKSACWPDQAHPDTHSLWVNSIDQVHNVFTNIFNMNCENYLLFDDCEKIFACSSKACKP
jgi:hypothetical protein